MDSKRVALKSVRRVLANCVVDGGLGGPEVDPGWGEPGLSPAEQVYGWCSFDVLAMRSGNPDAPVNATSPSAWARCQLRFVVGVDHEDILPGLRRHFARHGLDAVQCVEPVWETLFCAAGVAGHYSSFLSVRLAAARLLRRCNDDGERELCEVRRIVHGLLDLRHLSLPI